MKNFSLPLIIIFLQATSFAQDANNLLQKVKDKLDIVNNYEADAIMKTDVSFLKVPQANVKVYFKKPDYLKIKNEKGISFVPKGAVSISLNNIIGGNNFTVINGGTMVVNNIQTTILKLLPEDDNSNVILSTIYVDEKNAVIIKAKTTTKDNGTYNLEMKYGAYVKYGLPDEVVFIFNTKDYKMPKGVTFDYDDAEVKKDSGDKSKVGQGKIAITYLSYKINKGVSDEMFK